MIPTATPNPAARVMENLQSSVVRIAKVRDISAPGGSPVSCTSVNVPSAYQQPSCGSGFIVGRDGRNMYLLSSNNLLEGASKAEIFSLMVELQPELLSTVMSH
jgi:S1-C subfamily serine protease